MRILQVGLGGFGKRWAGFAGDHLVAVVDPDPAARAWAVDTLQLPSASCHPDLDSALAAGGFDAALVVSPPETHHPVTRHLLEAGFPVLVEKPLATTIDDALDLVRVAERTGQVLMVSQNYRFRRPARAVQQLIGSGAIGEVVAVEATCARDTRTIFPPGGFRYTMRHPFVLDMAIHHFDLLRALTGQDVTRVDARSWPAPDSPYQHHPTMAAVLDLENGAPVLFRGDWAARGPETSWNADWTITGAEGVVTWIGDVDDPAVGRVTLQRWGEQAVEVAQPDLPGTDQVGTLFAFQQAVESGMQPETSAADNVRSLAIVLGCVDSIERGAPVLLGDLLARPAT